MMIFLFVELLSRLVQIDWNRDIPVAVFLDYHDQNWGPDWLLLSYVKRPDDVLCHLLLPSSNAVAHILIRFA